MANRAEGLNAILPAKPELAPERKALTLEKRGGKWAILELTIVGSTVKSEREVDSQYYRDLAEDVAVRWLRRSAR